MNVEIWSDIVCPFCYIGKRNFENGLQQFKYRDNVKLTFKSFQLDPYSEKKQTQSATEITSRTLGVSMEAAKQMHQRVAAQAKAVGLNYQFESAVITNSQDSHRLTHFAKEHDKMEEMIERLYRAYFSEGKHIGDLDTLVSLAADIGLDERAARDILENDRYSCIVQEERQEGVNIGVQGVPFFIFNRNFAGSGAQPSQVFLEVL
jgi:predicted DsbA family dithiol-disulfide isomerase